MLQSIAGSIAPDAAEDTPSIIRAARLKKESLGSPRRSGFGTDKQDFNKILAQQNVITDRFHKHDVFFEQSEIQAGDMQTQLAEQSDQLSNIQDQLGILQDQYETMQRHQERIIDLLETLRQDRTSESISPGITEQLTTVVNGAPDVPTLGTPNVSITRTARPMRPTPSAQAAAKQAVPVSDLSKKGPRRRGRPRKLCKMCRREKPLQLDVPYCEDCSKQSRETTILKRPRPAANDPAENANAHGSKQPRLEYAQISRVKVARSDGKESVEHAAIPATQPTPQIIPVESIIDIPIRVSQPGDLTNPPKPETTTTKTPAGSSQLKAWQNPIIEKWNAEIASSAPAATSSQLAAPALNHPFIEDSAEPTPNYADIVDPESMDGTSTSSMRSARTATSVAESLPLDEIMDSARKDDANASRRNSNEKRDFPPRSARTEHDVIPLTRAPKANMIVKPRRPVAASSPEGKVKENHEILVQKIMGTSWRAVNRRF